MELNNESLPRLGTTSRRGLVSAESWYNTCVTPFRLLRMLRFSQAWKEERIVVTGVTYLHLYNLLGETSLIHLQHGLW